MPSSCPSRIGRWRGSLPWGGALFALVTLVTLTAGAAEPPTTVPPSRPAGAALAGEAAAPPGVRLPAHFTVEVRKDGAVYADGVALRALGDLSAIARRAAERRTFSGAAVYADRAPDRRRLVDVLGRAGFVAVRSSARPPPSALGAKVAAPVGQPLEAPASDTRALRPVSAVAPASRPVTKGTAKTSTDGAAVELATVGLHIGGAPRNEPNRQRLVRLFESQFEPFRGCYALAGERGQNALFGVDLLVPKGGGQAQVRETRTRLEGKAFHDCMRRAFQRIRFHPPPTARPEMVSYSVLFKPIPR